MRKQETKSKQVDEYISAQPPETQRALGELRMYIWQAAPHITELLNCKIPALALVEGEKRDQQIMIAAYRKHVGFYPRPSVIEAFSSQLAEYKSAKRFSSISIEQTYPEGTCH